MPNDPCDGDNGYTAKEIFQISEFLEDNMHFKFRELLSRQTVNISIGTDWPPLQADLIFYSYENKILIDS